MTAVPATMDDLAALRHALGTDAQTRAWLESLEQAGAPAFDVKLTGRDELPPAGLPLVRL
jgi:hypothetical protein